MNVNIFSYITNLYQTLLDVNREVIINISIFQAGVFQVIEPVMAGEELLDAVMMGVKAEELVRAGNQYIAIDLSTLDYIYSDSINRFINLNRAILDINGRIVIVAPHPKVYELLEKAGVMNFVKVCRSRDELMRVSEMISPTIAQAPVAQAHVTQAPVTQAPVAQAPVAQAPVAQAPVAQAPVAQAPVAQAPVAQAPVAQAPVAQAPVAQAPVAQAPVAQAPVAQAEIAPVGFESAESVYDAAPDVTQYIPSVEDETPSVISTENEVDFDAAFNFDSDISQDVITASNTSEYSPAPVHQEQHPVAFEMETPVDDLYTDGDSFLERKKSVAPLLAVLLVLVALFAGGLFLFLSSLHNNPKDKAPASDDLISTETAVEGDAKEIATEETSAPAVVEKKMTMSEKKQLKAEAKAAKKAAESAIEAVSGDAIVFTSAPSGVDILVNGDYIGSTPYTWKKPKVYGDVEIVFRKRDYADKVQRIEYLGGKKAITATLTATVIETRQPEERRAVELPREDDNKALLEKANAERAAAEKAASDKLAAEREAAQRAAEKAAAEREAAQRAAERAAAEREQAASAAVAEVADATIFFNSLPPMAEIYVDGKLVGKTNVKPVVIKPGAHTFEFKKDGMSGKYSATLRSGKNTAPMIRLE